MAKKKRGRPPRHAGEKLSKTRTFRVRGALDETLQEAATKAGRSVSEEIEHRLERSFYDDREARRFLGSEVGSEILRLIRLAMSLEAVTSGGNDWSEDVGSSQNVRIAVNAIIATFTGLSIDLPPYDHPHRQEGNRLAALLLLKSSAREKMPGSLACLAESERRSLEPATVPRPPERRS